MKVSPLTKTVVGLTDASAAYVWVQKRKNATSVEVAHPVEIHGFVSRGYEAVREAFADNFAKRRELGAACCVYHKGEKVVDFWGWYTKQSDRRSLGRGHDGYRSLHDQRPGGDDFDVGPFAWLARLRCAGV